jgi:hypothetical protein
MADTAKDARGWARAATEVGPLPEVRRPVSLGARGAGAPRRETMAALKGLQ